MSIRRAQDERIEGTPDGLNAISEIMDVPDAPTIGTATDNGDVSVSVTFTAAVRGGTPSTYTVTSTPGSITGTGASSPITVTGLTVGTAYTFKVKAANAAGVYGAESAASGSVTPAMPIPGAYTSLSVITVAAGGVASVTFDGIPSNYKHLQIRTLARSNRADSNDQIGMQFNGDVASNYGSHGLWGSGTSAASAALNLPATAISLPWTSGNNNTSGVFGAAVIDILDYASSLKNKTVRGLSGYDNNGSGLMALGSGLWSKTNPITSITIKPFYGSLWQQYSTFALYGVN